MAINQNQYSKSAAAYQHSQNSGLTMRGAMAESMLKILRLLIEAEEAYHDRKLDVMCAHSSKIFKYLTLLGEVLEDGDSPDAMEANNYLKQTYNITITRLANILLSENPSAEFTGLINQYKYLYKAWGPEEPVYPL